MKEATEQEWEAFSTERSAGVEEIMTLRQRVAEEDARKRSEQEAAAAEKNKDAPMAEDDRPAAPEAPAAEKKEAMDVDEGESKDVVPEREHEREVKEEAAPMQADDDDAVEY